MRLKSIFFGTPDFAIPSFQALVAQTDCRALICQPDKARGRGHKVLPCPTKEIALSLGLPSFAPASLRKESPELNDLRTFLAANPVDIFMVLAYGNILTEEFLSGARLGCFNIHGSLLPRWRGAAPIQRAIEAGDTTTGICIQRMVQKLDAGNVITQQSCSIGPDESAIELTQNLSLLSAKVLSEFLSRVANNTVDLQGVAQDESLVTHAAKISKEEVYFSNEWSAQEAHHKVRAFRAWPQVKIRTSENLEIKLLKTQLVKREELKDLRPGEVRVLEKSVFLGCRVRPGESENLEIVEAQAPNKSPQSAFLVFSNSAR